MVAALIVVDVIAFLAIDAYVLMRYFRGRRSAGRYGAVVVPGEGTFVLSPGKVKLTYQDSSSGVIQLNEEDFEAPSDLEVSVVAADGEALEIKGPGFRETGSSTDTSPKWKRALVGTVEIPAPGTYRVSAEGTTGDAVEPQILVGA
jgi:hypothetical protein